MQTLWQDLRFAVRMLKKNPGFTIVAVLTLAVAIGANAVVFSVMNGLFLRALNVPQPESLYTLERMEATRTKVSRTPIISICAIATAALITSSPITSTRPLWTPAIIRPAPGFTK
jgi:hypothetical protein